MHIDEEEGRIDNHIAYIRDSIQVESNLPKRIDKNHGTIDTFHKPIGREYHRDPERHNERSSDRVLFSSFLVLRARLNCRRRLR